MLLFYNFVSFSFFLLKFQLDRLGEEYLVNNLFFLSLILIIIIIFWSFWNLEVI